MPETVLVVEDEPEFADLLELWIGRAGYRSVGARTGTDALRRFYEERPDLVVLDVSVPDLDGWQMIERIREFSRVPILMVTARSSEADKIRGLKLGADDYMTKPVSFPELLARIEAALRRASTPSESRPRRLQSRDLIVDLDEHRAYLAGTEVRLTPTEFRLLSYLVEHAGQLVTHRQVLSAVWGSGYDTDVHLLRMTIRNLRLRLETVVPTGGAYIATEYGLGYRLTGPRYPDAGPTPDSCLTGPGTLRLANSRRRPTRSAPARRERQRHEHELVDLALELGHGGFGDRHAYLAEGCFELVPQIALADLEKRVPGVDDNAANAVFHDHRASEPRVERPDDDLRDAPAGSGAALAGRARRLARRLVAIRFALLVRSGLGCLGFGRLRIPGRGQRELPVRTFTRTRTGVALEELPGFEEAEGAGQDPADLFRRSQGSGTDRGALLAGQPPNHRCQETIEAGIGREPRGAVAVDVGLVHRDRDAGHLYLSDEPVHGRVERRPGMTEPLP
ncbi:MAG TPA: response regulator transcription factor [Candidatus Limnocylindrales bacterium]